MSQHAVITDGFGTFGSTHLVITEGYSSGEATPFPLCISIGMKTEYGITISRSVEYGIATSHGGCT